MDTILMLRVVCQFSVAHPELEVLGPDDCSQRVPPELHKLPGEVWLVPVCVYSPDDCCTLVSTLVVWLRDTDVRTHYVPARPEHVRLADIDALTRCVA